MYKGLIFFKSCMQDIGMDVITDTRKITIDVSVM